MTRPDGSDKSDYLLNGTDVPRDLLTQLLLATHSQAEAEQFLQSVTRTPDAPEDTAEQREQTLEIVTTIEARSDPGYILLRLLAATRRLTQARSRAPRTPVHWVVTWAPGHAWQPSGRKVSDQADSLGFRTIGKSLRAWREVQ